MLQYLRNLRKMKKRIIIYFFLFGLIFGLVNQLDRTGGDIPYSKLLNVPTLYVQGVVESAIRAMGRARFNRVKEETGTVQLNPSLSRDEFEKLSLKEQEDFISKMRNQKNTVREDSVIGEKGSLYLLRRLLFSFPVLSALTWGLIGAVFYMVRKHSSPSG